MGLQREDVIGQPVSRRMFRTDEGYRACRDCCAAAEWSGKEVRTEWSFERDDGLVFVAMVSGQGINIPGFERSAVWVYEDITDRKNAGTRDRQENEERLRRILETARWA